MADFKETAANDFIIALNKVRKKAVAEIARLRNSLSAEELQVIITTKLESFILNDLGLQNDIDTLMGAYKESLKGMTAFAKPNKVTLNALFRADRTEWLNVAKLEISSIQKELFNASMTGEWDNKAILDRLFKGQQGSLSKPQINTLVDTALSDYERNVTTSMMNEMPDDTLYVYAGPLDDKTMDICAAMIHAGELTESEIISNFGSEVLEIGGGFNCRHRWTLSLSKDSAKRV